MRTITLFAAIFCLTLVSCKKDVEPTTSGSVVNNPAIITLNVPATSTRVPINLVGLQVFNENTRKTWKTVSGAIVFDATGDEVRKTLGFYNFAFECEGSLHQGICDAYLERIFSDGNYKLTCISRNGEFTVSAIIHVQPITNDTNKIEVSGGSIY